MQPLEHLTQMLGKYTSWWNGAEEEEDPLRDCALSEVMLVFKQKHKKESQSRRLPLKLRRQLGSTGVIATVA